MTRRKPANGFRIESNRPGDNHNRNQVVPALYIALMRPRSCFQTLSQSLLAFQDEAVKYIARINVISRNRPRYTDALGERFQLTSALPSSGVMTPIAAKRGSRIRPPASESGEVA